MSGELHFNHRCSVSAKVDGISADDEYYWTTGVRPRYQPTQLWDLSFGGRMIDGKLDRDALFNEVKV